MTKSARVPLTPLARVFLTPTNTTHRQYEALRAYFVDELPSAQAARRFGYTPASFRVLCWAFRKDPHRPFFLDSPRGPKPSPQRDRLRDTIVGLRKQNHSVYDISHVLEEQGLHFTPSAVARIVKEEGFARLPRRKDEERPATLRPDPAAIADVRALDLSPRTFRTRFGGLFLFLPFLAPIPLDTLLKRSGFPGTRMIPAGAAVRSLLALKLFGSARHSHVMSQVFDEGLALFAGINAIPKRSFLTEYSCRLHPRSHRKLMRSWFDAVEKLGVARGVSFDLDFHTIPFHGEDALVQKHYVSKRSRRQKGILAFLAQDAQTRVFCYANADVRKEEQDDEILAFARYWKRRTGHYPEEVVFDSRLTTYANLDWLNRKHIAFLTLRRRSKRTLREIEAKPPSAWRRVELEGVGRIYRTPRVLDERITVRDYRGELRQLTVADLGHEEPTLVLTNQLRRSPRHLITRYARRMVIENGIAEGIDFFHMDALSSAVALKVNCDLQLTLMASSLYRLLAARIGNGYPRAKARHLFRDFVDATAVVRVGEEEIVVRFQKRAHNPLLKAAGFEKTDVPIPWLGGKRLRIVLG